MKYRLLVFVFFLFISFAGSLGMTEDEAYYWVLSQKLSLGYAFHPPGVAWIIRIFEVLFSLFATKATPWLTRLPAVLITVFTLALSMNWFEKFGGFKNRIEGAAIVLLSFAGMFAVSWMIVPDLPFLLGWIICFYQLSKKCFKNDETVQGDIILFLGVIISVLSKYTAVFILVSALACSFHFLNRKQFVRTAGVLLLAAFVGFLPNLIWNANHHFGPLLYQFSERHSGGHFIFSRYLRFWALQWVLAGPLVLFTFEVFKEAIQKKEIERYAALWIIPPALIFWIQPAFSDFKFHWTLISWFPTALILALKYSKGEALTYAKAQKAVGLTLIALVLVCFQMPLVAFLGESFNKKIDPKFDITNDVYGWSELAKQFKLTAEDAQKNLPWVGSRYQTAALAAYSLKDASKVELLPRDEKSLDEWPDLRLTDSRGPEWPKIEKPFVFAADNRFSAPPEFKGGDCSKKQDFKFYRAQYLAKTITLYYCRPY